MKLPKPCPDHLFVGGDKATFPEFIECPICHWKIWNGLGKGGNKKVFGARWDR